MVKLAAASILFVICNLTPALSRADTFQVYRLAEASNTTINGMDKAGDVLITDLNSGSPVYKIYNGPTVVYTSPIYPDSFVPDNGSVTGGSHFLSFSVTNGRYSAYGDASGLGELIPIFETYPGPPSGSEMVYFGDPSAVHVFLNSVGDLTFTDLLTTQIEIIDSPGMGSPTTTTPEPSGFALLATGLLGAAAMVGRRRNAVGGA